MDVRPANLSTLQRAAKHPADGLTVVDAPPQGRLLEAAITPADFVIASTSDSPLDLQQAWATMNSIPESKTAAVLIVRAETNTRAYQAIIDALDGNRTPRCDTVVRKRQDIKVAMGHKSVKLWNTPKCSRSSPRRNWYEKPQQRRIHPHPGSRASARPRAKPNGAGANG